MPDWTDAELRDRLARFGVLEAVSDAPTDLDAYLDYALADLHEFRAYWAARDDDPRAGSVLIFIDAGLMHLEGVQRRLALARVPA
jgi:hypothetical protein